MQNLDKKVKREIKQFLDLLLTADEVVVTTVCCDSRVNMPKGTVEIKDSRFHKQSKKKVIFLPIPVIGGGHPSKSRIRKIKNVILSLGVDKSKIRILITQHGDTKELENQGILQGPVDFDINSVSTPTHNKHISCGLRKFFFANSQKLIKLHELLRRYSEMKKRANQDKSFAPDRQTLEFLEEDCPQIIELVNLIHESSGPKGKRIPRRLIIRSAYRNSSFDLSENTNSVAMKVSEFLKESENNDIYLTCAVYEAAYDHQKKEMTFAQYAQIGDEIKIALPNLVKRNDFIQDPENAVIVYGEKAILYPIESMISEDMQKADNNFRSIATTPSVPHLLCAMSEISYAVIHHNYPHHGDKNFVSLKNFVIICENDTYYEILRETLHSKEWLEEYHKIFTDFVSEIRVIILEQNNILDPITRTIALGKGNL